VLLCLGLHPANFVTILEPSNGFQTENRSHHPKIKEPAMSAADNLILIVEDDPKTASLVSLYLEKEGFATIIAKDGQRAVQLARARKPIFVVLDLMLPKMDGWEVCRLIRADADVPILMLTARDDEVDRISGLTMGADDYVSKPFSPRELVARVKAILRRGRLKNAVEEKRLSAGALTMDVAQHRVTLAGAPVALTPHEYTLLRALMSGRGRVFTRDELLTRLYPNNEAIVIERVVDVHIGKLRQKIEANPSKPAFIETVRGVGYRFGEALLP
jgi:DNA-binding response OmpR family regulator